MIVLDLNQSKYSDISGIEYDTGTSLIDLMMLDLHY